MSSLRRTAPLNPPRSTLGQVRPFGSALKFSRWSTVGTSLKGGKRELRERHDQIGKAGVQSQFCARGVRPKLLSPSTFCCDAHTQPSIPRFGSSRPTDAPHEAPDLPTLLSAGVAWPFATRGTAGRQPAAHHLPDSDHHGRSRYTPLASPRPARRFRSLAGPMAGTCRSKAGGARSLQSASAAEEIRACAYRCGHILHASVLMRG